MSRNQPLAKLNLRHEPGGSRIRVDLESFFDFSFWMAEQLEALVRQHRPRHLPPAKVGGTKPPAGQATPPHGLKN